MSDSCCASPPGPGDDPAYRKILWASLALNALMFAVEFGASWTAGSVSLLADSIDFLGDAANYALSLAVLGMAIATPTCARYGSARATMPWATSP